MYAFHYSSNPIIKSFYVKNDVFERYNDNLKIQNGKATGIDYIYSQGTLKNWKYGTSDVVVSGCGAVAFYNAMTLLGKRVDFSTIVTMFDFYG